MIIEPVNLSKTLRDTTSVHQRAADFLQNYKAFCFVTIRLKCNDRLIKGLFQRKCTDVYSNKKNNYFEISII